jgi:hypothetical protein
MTAAVVDTTPGSGSTVNATGCDIGTYYDSGATASTLSGVTVENATQYGVFVDGGKGDVSVDVSDSSIHNIGDVPFDGAQHGNAIYYYGYNTTGTVSGTVSGNTVYQYQKGGIITNGGNASTVVTDNTVTGLGPVSFIAQNGVQSASVPQAARPGTKSAPTTIRAALTRTQRRPDAYRTSRRGCCCTASTRRR